MSTEDDISYIYIITDGENFKVGVTKNDPLKRLKQLQTGNPKILRIARTFKLPSDKVYSLEREAHKAIQRRYAKRGEWFKSANGWDIGTIVDMICEKDLID